MRLNYGEGNGASLAGGTSQDSARIARTIFNVVVCRAFMRAVLSSGIDRQWTVTERHDKYRPLIDRLELSRFARLSPPR
jgi:hypothetical protein